MTNQTATLEAVTQSDQNTSSKSRHHVRWTIAVLALAALALGGLKVSENTASAAAGSIYVKVCWVDQFGRIANAKVSSQYYHGGNPKTWSTARTDRSGCATVSTPTGSTVRFTVSKSVGNCPSWYCFVTNSVTGWYSTRGLAAGGTYNIGWFRANTILIDNGYQASQYIIDNM